VITLNEVTALFLGIVPFLERAVEFDMKHSPACFMVYMQEGMTRGENLFSSRVIVFIF